MLFRLLVFLSAVNGVDSHGRCALQYRFGVFDLSTAMFVDGSACDCSNHTREQERWYDVRMILFFYSS